MIIFRADANEHIGTGHVMRCLSIAKAAIKNGIEAEFVVADEVSAEVVIKNGLQAHILHSDWKDLEKELQIIKEYVEKKEADWLLVDSYYMSQMYLTKLREVTKVAYIDDFMDEVYPCDAIINYAIYADEEFYKKNYPDSLRLIGCEYVPLREAFTNLKPKKINEKVKNVLVLSGGSDPYHFQFNLANKIADTKEDFNEIDFLFVCGRYNKDFDKILELGQKKKNIKAIQHTDKIEDLMLQVDIVISAAGSTLYELCACGTPTISYIFADNQRQNAEGFEEKGIIAYVGDLRKGEEIYLKIKKKIESLAGYRDSARIMSKKMCCVIDGRGAFRIQKLLCN